MGRLFKLAACGVLLFALQHLAAPAVAAPEDFPVPVSLQPAVDFWTKVYTQISTREGYLHDSRDLSVIYEVVEVPPDASSRTRRKVVEKVRKRYETILRELARGKRDSLTAEQARVLALWPEGVTNAQLKQAASRVRFQLGQSDRFRAGIERSGRWLPFIRQTLAEHGVPQELAYLPHVESSFNPTAHSHASAVGIWQFTRGTGRRYMRIDHVVDERLDPHIATVAAARLLKSNLGDTGAWPLAVTAYNHGSAGMRRATRKLGTRDIGEIVARYKSRTFGFASRNFYVSFRAAVRVAENAEAYFGTLQLDSPARYEAVTPGVYIDARTMARTLGVDYDLLRDFNPALKAPVWNGDKYIPQNYPLRVPAPVSAPEALAALAALDRSLRHSRQTPDLTHRVQSGETISQIASRYGVSTSSLVAMNGLRSRHFIRAGQVLKLPQVAGSSGAKPRQTAPPVLAGRAKAQPAPVSVKTGGVSGFTYRVQNGDSLSRIASRFGVTQRMLIATNGLRDKHRIYKGQVLVIPGADGPIPETYRVQRGDTLSVVAARFGLTQRQLAALNDIDNRHRIYEGQVLRLRPPLSG